MKKFIIAIAMVVLATYGFAAETIQVKTVDGSDPYMNSYRLFSAVSTSNTTSTGPAKFLQMPISKHMCTGTWAGTVPTSLIFTVDGSEDGANFVPLATVTMTSSPYVFHIDKPSIVYTRGTTSTSVGGDNTTKFTLTCTSGGN